MEQRLTAWAPSVLSLLRLVTGLLFLEHGLMKIFHFPAAQPGLNGPLTGLLLMAGWMEVIGGALVTVGLFTRIAAFLLAGEMAVAYWTVHAKAGPWPALNEGDAAILYCFIFLYLVFAGGGRWSLDNLAPRRIKPL